jgi:hypothetical protein
MTNTSGPGGPSSDFLPMWGWVALAIAAVAVLGLLFTWSGDIQQQAETQTTPPATSSPSTPPKSPQTPPAQ